MGESPNDDREIALVAQGVEPGPVRTPASKVSFDASFVSPAKGLYALEWEAGFLEKILHSKRRPAGAIDRDLVYSEEKWGGEEEKAVRPEHLIYVARGAIRVG